ncbi:uncharacterized protein [Periplaneta americana]|uniref:uncharacterized protein n=1 Tax=Periplaneta americana TaxID=6978 RepID=UPI0037E88DBF
MAAVNLLGILFLATLTSSEVIPYITECGYGLIRQPQPRKPLTTNATNPFFEEEMKLLYLTLDSSEPLKCVTVKATRNSNKVNATISVFNKEEGKETSDIVTGTIDLTQGTFQPAGTQYINFSPLYIYMLDTDNTAFIATTCDLGKRKFYVLATKADANVSALTQNLDLTPVNHDDCSGASTLVLQSLGTMIVFLSTLKYLI